MTKSEKQDYIINCPACKGTGEALFEEKWSPDETDENFDPSAYYYRLVTSERAYQEYIEGDYTKGYIHHSKKCPFCEGNGVAYAWFEKSKRPVDCSICQGKGKISTTVKLEVGVKKASLPCNSCNGEGKVPAPEVAHVLTPSGGNPENSDREASGIGGEWGDYYTAPFRFSTEIWDGNREFYAKRKPR
jgi:RecJ-like exonuclease